MYAPTQDDMSPGLLLCTKCDVGVSFSLWMCSNSILRRAGGCHLLTLIHSLMLSGTRGHLQRQDSSLEPSPESATRDILLECKLFTTSFIMYRYGVSTTLPCAHCQCACTGCPVFTGRLYFPLCPRSVHRLVPRNCVQQNKEDHPTQIACRQRGGPVTIVCGIETYAR